MNKNDKHPFRVKVLSKEYSAFRDDLIKKFIEEVLPSSKVILDPMAGTASLLPHLKKPSMRAYFNDLIPIHTFINQAKTLATYNCVKRVTHDEPDFFKNELMGLLRPLKNKKLLMSDKWIPDEILDPLLKAWTELKTYEGHFKIFLKAILLLCVRPLSSVSMSEKNATWYRPGGMSTHIDIESIIDECLSKYSNYYKKFYDKTNIVQAEQVNFLTEDASVLKLYDKVDTIITSPGYANRYDCTRMFGPELYFLEHTLELSNIDFLKTNILATNVVKDYPFPEKDLSNLSKVAPKTYKFLIEVKNKSPKKEKFYYLRYFAKYYSRLYRIFDNMEDLLSENGVMYIVVQNNIHRGELNAMDDFLEDHFIKKGLKVDRFFVAARTHQGKRNISADHPLVLKKQLETILKVEK